MLSRTRSCRIVLVVAVAIGMVAPLLAQESEDICIANGVVARIRTAGPYASLKERAATVDQAIAEVISTQDTQSPQISVKEVDDIWHIFVGPVKVIGVYPAEAEANAIAARQLAAIWANSIRERLPLTTPVSKTPPGATLPQLSPVSPLPPAEEPVEAPATPPAEVAVPPAAEEEPMPRSAALLLVVDAFNVVRSLSEDDYLGTREGVAVNLIKNLRPFIALAALAEIPPVVEAPSPITSRATVGPPVVTPAEPVTLAPAEVEVPTVAPAPTMLYIPVPGITATTGVPEGYEDDPAYARVPQKHRIRAKFKYAQEPYQQLATEDAAAAQAVGELLRVARTAFAVGNFDDSERYLDHALRLLGAVPLAAPEE